MLNLISDGYYSISNAFNSSKNIHEFAAKAFLTPVYNSSSAYFAGHTLFGGFLGIHATANFIDSIRKIRREGLKQSSIRDVFNIASISTVVLPAAASIGYAADYLQFCFTNLTSYQAFPLLALCTAPLAYWGMQKIYNGASAAAGSVYTTAGKIAYLRFKDLTRQDYINLIAIGSSITIGISSILIISGKLIGMGLAGGAYALEGVSYSTALVAPLFGYVSTPAWWAVNNILPYVQIINSWATVGNSVFRSIDVLSGRNEGIKINLDGKYSFYLGAASTVLAAVGIGTGNGGLAFVGTVGVGVSLFAYKGINVEKPVILVTSVFAAFQIFRSSAKLLAGLPLVTSLPSLGPLAVLGSVGMAVGYSGYLQYNQSNHPYAKIAADLQTKVNNLHIVLTHFPWAQLTTLPSVAFPPLQNRASVLLNQHAIILPGSIIQYPQINGSNDLTQLLRNTQIYFEYAKNTSRKDVQGNQNLKDIGSALYQDMNDLTQHLNQQIAALKILAVQPVAQIQDLENLKNDINICKKIVMVHDRKSIFQDGHDKAMLRIVGNLVSKVPIAGWFFDKTIGVKEIELRSNWSALPLTGAIALAGGMIAMPTLMLSFSLSLPFSYTAFTAGVITASMLAVDRQWGIVLSGAMNYTLQMKSPEHIKQAERLSDRVGELHKSVNEFDWTYLNDLPVVNNSARNPTNLFGQVQPQPLPQPSLPAIDLPVGIEVLTPIVEANLGGNPGVGVMPHGKAAAFNQFTQDLQLFSAHLSDIPDINQISPQEKQRLHAIGSELGKGFERNILRYFNDKLKDLNSDKPRPNVQIEAINDLRKKMIDCRNSLESLTQYIDPQVRTR